MDEVMVAYILRETLQVFLSCLVNLNKFCWNNYYCKLILLEIFYLCLYMGPS